MLSALSSRLRRTTTTGNYMPEVDGLRFLAISSVFLLHVSAWMRVNAASPSFKIAQESVVARLLSHGYWGVQLFFIVSGFILGHPFARHYLKGSKKPGLKAYMLRRLTRLEPPYIIAMTFWMLTHLVTEHKGTGPLLQHYFASLTYTHNLVYHSMNTMINGVAWSLEVEVQFYLLVPLLARMYSIKDPVARRGLFTVLIATFTLLRPVIMANNDWLHLTLITQLQFFLVGLLIADLYVGGMRKLSTSTWDALGLGSLVGLCGLSAITAIAHPYIPVVVVPLMFFVVMGALQGNVMKRMLSLEWVATIGGMCYTIYLIHDPLITFVLRHTEKIVVTHNYVVNFLVQSTFSVIVVLFATTIFYLLVEKPCMDKDWPQKLWARLTGAPTQARAVVSTIEESKEPEPVTPGA